MQPATTQVAATARTWTEAVSASLIGAFSTALAVIPRVLGFILIVVIGWFIASLIAKAVAALLRAVKFNDLARRSGFTEFTKNMGANTDAAGVIALTAKWFIRLIALVVAFDALGLPAVSDVLRQLLLWLPNLVVALVVLIIGGLAANALSGLVRGATAEAGFTNPDILATVARVAVWAFAIVVAVNQLGIATALINTLLIGVVGALALAAGLAFGLGGRNIAGQVLEDWYQQSATTGRKIRRAAEAASERGGRQRTARDEDEE